MRPEPCESDELRAELPAAELPFEALFRDHFGFVYQNLRRLGVPPAAIEDAVQEVFLVVLRRPDAPITSVRGWLFGIARRIAWRQRRTAARQNRLALALAEAAPPALDGAGAAAEREAAALLERFLGRLDEDKRAVFLLAELEQMTAPEIARALGVKENTVYSRLRAARQEFDRSFARVRLRERRATGEAGLEERALLLSRARRAHEPSPAARQRVWLLLWGPAGAGAGLAGAREAAAASGPAGPGQASAWTGAGAKLEAAALPARTAVSAKLGAAELPARAAVGAKLGAAELPARAAVSAKLGAAELPARAAVGVKLGAGGHAVWAAAVGIAGVLVIAAVPPAPPDAPAAAASSETPARGEAGPIAPASAPVAAPAGDHAVPFARLAAAAARAEQAATGPRPRRADTPINVSKDMSEETFIAPSSAAPVDLDALRREAALMADARAALRGGAWTRAHELLQRHALEFPAGALVEERRLSRVEVLCSMGQVAAARAEATQLAGERPGSGLARKASALCLRDPSTAPGRPGD